MNYYDFLNKRLSTNGLPAGYSISNDGKSNVKSDNKTTNAMDKSIFKPASREDLSKVDYKKVLGENKQGENVEMTSLEYSLKEFFALDQVKAVADKDGDGKVSEEEAKAYVDQMALKDGDGETLSLDDFEKVISEQGIDLDAISKFLSSQGAFEQPAEVAAHQQAPATASAYSGGGGGGVSNYAAPAPKTIHNMSLNELKSEKENRESTLSEKQDALKEVQAGETEGIKTAKEQMKDAKEAYEDALKNDEKTSKFAKVVSDTNSKIEKNQSALDKNSTEITNKQSEITQQNSTISATETMLSSLKNTLSGLPAPTGKPEDKERDAQIESKKSQLQKEISSKEVELRKQKAQLDKLNKGLDELENQKTQLESEKNTLLDRKTKFDELVNKNCSETIKAKLEAYNNAVKNVDAVKAKELEAANSAYSSAQKQVQEINIVIAQKEANAAASKYSVSSDKIDKALELAESQIGVHEIGGSNDSAEIRKYKNGAANGNPWCASFASWLYGAGQESSNDKTFGYTASSQEIKRKAYSAGCYASKNSNYVPQKGDLAMWSKSASSGHVGIVSEVYADGSFDVIEGNSGNAVKKRHYSSKHSAGGSFDGFVQMDKWLQA